MASWSVRAPRGGGPVTVGLLLGVTLLAGCLGGEQVSFYGSNDEDHAVQATILLRDPVSGAERFNRTVEIPANSTDALLPVRISRSITVESDLVVTVGPHYELVRIQPNRVNSVALAYRSIDLEIVVDWA